MRQSADITHWFLQYVLGFMVGGVSGAFFGGEQGLEGSGILLLGLAGGLGLAGLASLYGDDLWYSMTDHWTDGAPAYSSSYGGVEHNAWTKIISWVSLLSCLGMVAFTVLQMVPLK